MAARDGSAEPVGYEKVTGLTSAKSLTVPLRARYCSFRVEGGDVRYRDDGTDASATEGMLWKATDGIFWYTGKPAALSFFEATATATLFVLYYG